MHSHIRWEDGSTHFFFFLSKSCGRQNVCVAEAVWFKIIKKKKGCMPCCRQAPDLPLLPHFPTPSLPSMVRTGGVVLTGPSSLVSVLCRANQPCSATNLSPWLSPWQAASITPRLSAYAGVPCYCRRERFRLRPRRRSLCLVLAHRVPSQSTQIIDNRRQHPFVSVFITEQARDENNRT